MVDVVLLLGVDADGGHVAGEEFVAGLEVAGLGVVDELEVFLGCGDGGGVSEEGLVAVGDFFNHFEVRFFNVLLLGDGGGLGVGVVVVGDGLVVVEVVEEELGSHEGVFFVLG